MNKQSPSGAGLSRRHFLGAVGCAGAAAAALSGLGAASLLSTLSGCNVTVGRQNPGLTSSGIFSTAAENHAALQAGDQDYFEFTDSAGRKVALAREVQRVAPSGAYAQLLLSTVCREKLVGLSSRFSDAQAKYLGQELLDLPVLGRFYGKNADLNYEELMRLKPDVIVDMGEAKVNIANDMDGLQQQTGIPVIFIEATAIHLDSAYAMLGDALSVHAAAKPLSQYAQEALVFATRRQPEIAVDGLKLLYGYGPDGLQVKEKGSVHSGVIDLIGLDNVAVLSDTNSNQVSIEQVMIWQPEVLLLSPSDGFFDDIYRDPVWQGIAAVKNRRVYEVPGKPYEWLDMPPSVQTLLGLYWLGNLLYPELYDFDIIEKAQEFYKLFWRYDLSREEARGLMANSTFLAA
jgi:iron complex transport system substrate-binding protein